VSNTGPYLVNSAKGKACGHVAVAARSLRRDSTRNLSTREGWAFAAAAVAAFLLAACGASTPSQATRTTTPHGIVVKVKGTGPANISIIDDVNISNKNGVRLPWTETLTAGSFVQVTATDQSGSAAATLSCELDVPGQRPITDIMPGANAIVTCTKNAS